MAIATQRHLDQLLRELQAKLEPKLSALAEAIVANRTSPPTIEQRAKRSGLTVDEQLAFDAVAEHVNQFFADQGFHLRQGITLSDYVRSRLCDEGHIGISLLRNGMDDLDRFAPCLASALAKLEARLPGVPNHPLCPA